MEEREIGVWMRVDTLREYPHIR